MGFDSSPRAMERGKQLLTEEGLEAELRVHDMFKRPPYPNGFFDAVIATRVIHHVPLEGVERGVPHHCFRQEELLGLFLNYELGNFTGAQPTTEAFAFSQKSPFVR